MSDLITACRVVEDRKVALIGADSAGGPVDTSSIMLLAVGLELDFRELEERASSLADMHLSHLIEDGAAIASSLKGLWAEGLITGMLLAELRANAERREAGRS